MRCEDVKELLVAHADGELTPEERERVDSHLANCEGCRRERAALGSTGDLLALLGESPPAGRGFAAKVLAAARGEDPWCGHIRRELPALLDGELSEDEARPVREHLATCAACEAERRGLARTDAALALWTLPPFAANLARRVAPPRPARGRLYRIAAAAAAAGVLLAAGVALFTSGPSPAAAPPAELLRAMDVLDPQTLDLLDQDPALIDIARDIDLLDDLSDDEIALLTTNGSGG